MRVVTPGIVMGAEPAWWKTILTFLSFAVKTLFFIFLFMWVRWTVPRFRYDQIMHLGWKVMLPVALAYVTFMAAAILVLDTVGITFGWLYGLILTLVNLVPTAVFLWLLDRDRVIGGTARAPEEALRRRPRRPVPTGVTVGPDQYAGSSSEKEDAGWR
jgi:NADH-quinone oxidoreductase subunit H